MGFLSRVPAPTVAATRKHAFFAQLVAVQQGKQITPAQLAAARLDARHLRIGWVLVWRWNGRTRTAIRYLRETGFRLGYTADGVKVYRPDGVKVHRAGGVKVHSVKVYSAGGVKVYRARGAARR